jgi:hypothetical protein
MLHLLIIGNPGVKNKNMWLQKCDFITHRMTKKDGKRKKCRKIVLLNSSRHFSSPCNSFFLSLDAIKGFENMQFIGLVRIISSIYIFTTDHAKSPKNCYVIHFFCGLGRKVYFEEFVKIEINANFKNWN